MATGTANLSSLLSQPAPILNPLRRHAYTRKYTLTAMQQVREISNTIAGKVSCRPGARAG